MAQNDIAGFIRERRGNETHFAALSQKLNEMLHGAAGEQKEALSNARDKAAVYQKARESGGTAWPEFESFVTEFERAVLNKAEGKQ